MRLIAASSGSQDTDVLHIRGAEPRFRVSDGTNATAIDQQFSLAVSFDPANPAPVGNPYPYGSVVFSTIPLGPAPPPGLDVSLFGPSNYAFHNGFTTFFGTPRQYGVAASVNRTEIGFAVLDGQPTNYYREARLENLVSPLDAPAVISPETFPVHLSFSPLGRPFNFMYRGCIDVEPFVGGVCTGTAPGSQRLFYSGVATLLHVESPDPIPEPATVGLIGGGLAMLALRRRQNARRFRALR